MCVCATVITTITAKHQCAYTYVCVCVYAEHLPLFETSLVCVHIFLLLYTSLKSVKIRMF